MALLSSRLDYNLLHNTDLSLPLYTLHQTMGRQRHVPTLRPNGHLSPVHCLGLFYRLATTLFWLAFTYVFLLDQANYLNHFYLVCLISGLLIVIPAHHTLSLARWLSPTKIALWVRHLPGGPSIFRRGSVPPPMLSPHQTATTIPYWSLLCLRLQLSIVYIYGGIAKLNYDWLGGQPMRLWLADRLDFPVVGHLFTEEWVVYFFSYGGLLFDLCVVPLLLWPRTRPIAFLVSLIFHLTNAALFDIGIFPWFMIAATTLFFEPEWPKQWLTLGRPITHKKSRAKQNKNSHSPPHILPIFTTSSLFHPTTTHPLASSPVPWPCQLDRRRTPLCLAHETAYQRSNPTYVSYPPPNSRDLGN